MRNNKIYENLILAIKERVPSGENHAAWVSGLLKIEKESAYRRLRGEVLFTFDEIATIARSLDLSVDALIGISMSNQIVFDFKRIDSSDLFGVYARVIGEYTGMYDEVRESEGTFSAVTNRIPYYFLFTKSNLAHFSFYKWIYQTQKVAPNYSFSDFAVPEYMDVKCREYVKSIQGVANASIVFDNNLFLHAVRDILYFRRRNLLSAEESGLLKEELYRMLDDMEKITTEGKTDAGATINIYVSDIDIDGSYWHVIVGNKELSQVKIYYVDGLDSLNPRIGELQSKWIDSFKKFSTLISQSGEIKRFEYLEEQRKFVDMI